MKPDRCPVCLGSGTLPDTWASSPFATATCYGCNGKGWIALIPYRLQDDTQQPYSTLRHHARAREAAWLDTHPSGHEYQTHDLIRDAMEELADCYNYIQNSALSPQDKRTLCRELNEVWKVLRRAG